SWTNCGDGPAHHGGWSAAPCYGPGRRRGAKAGRILVNEGLGRRTAAVRTLVGGRRRGRRGGAPRGRPAGHWGWPRTRLPVVVALPFTSGTVAVFEGDGLLVQPAVRPNPTRSNKTVSRRGMTALRGWLLGDVLDHAVGDAGQVVLGEE